MTLPVSTKPGLGSSAALMRGQYYYSDSFISSGLMRSCCEVVLIQRCSNNIHRIETVHVSALCVFFAGLRLMTKLQDRRLGVPGISGFMQ